MIHKKEEQFNGIYFLRDWLLMAILGALLAAATRYFTHSSMIIVVLFAGYVGLAGWLLVSTHRAYQRVQNRLYAQCQEDQLTGVKNRRYLIDRMKELLSRYERDGSGFSIILFDLDNFKDFNTQFGHTTGDRLLQEVAGFLQASTREQEPLARYGGDEFVLLLPDAGLKQVQDTAARIRLELGKKFFQVKNQPYSLSISYGVAVCPEDGTEIEQLLNAADLNLYQAKKNRGHRA